MLDRTTTSCWRRTTRTATGCRRRWWSPTCGATRTRASTAARRATSGARSRRSSPSRYTVSERASDGGGATYKMYITVAQLLGFFDLFCGICGILWPIWYVEGYCWSLQKYANLLACLAEFVADICGNFCKKPCRSPLSVVLDLCVSGRVEPVRCNACFGVRGRVRFHGEACNWKQKAFIVGR